MMNNGACVEALRGAQLNEQAQRKPGGFLAIVNKRCSAFKSGKSGDHRDEDLLQELVSKFGVHASFVANPFQYDRSLFVITGFMKKDNDLLNSAFISLLRNSSSFPSYYPAAVLPQKCTAKM